MFDEALTDSLAKASVSTEAFVKLFFPPEETDKYEIPFSWLHREILTLLDDPEKQKVGVLAPRGIGKTSMFHAFIMRLICFRKVRYVMYVSTSATHAEQQTENIKELFQANQLIKNVFGSPKISDYKDGDAIVDDSFAKKSWIAYGNTIVVPRGSGQQVRGALWRGHRPDLIVIDDLEDDELIQNELNREKQLEWFLGSLIKCVNRKKPYKIGYIDTLKHEDALPMHLYGLPDWTWKRYSICDDKYRSHVPDFMTDEQIELEVKSYTEAGKLDTFYREMMNIPIAPGTASFQSRFFKYFQEQDLVYFKHPLESIIIVDPAKSVTPQSDFSAIIGVSVDLENRNIYVRDIFNERVYPDQLYKACLEMARRLGARTIGLEVTSLNEFITFPFYQFLVDQGAIDIEVVELKPRQKKEDRIRTLIPLYRTGLISHNKTCSNVLEQQLLTFPRSAHDDVMDALAYIAEMFQEGGRYFHPPELDEKQVELEYPNDDEDPIELEAYATWSYA